MEIIKLGKETYDKFIRLYAEGISQGSSIDEELRETDDLFRDVADQKELMAYVVIDDDKRPALAVVNTIIWSDKQLDFKRIMFKQDLSDDTIKLAIGTIMEYVRDYVKKEFNITLMVEFPKESIH